MKLKSLVLLLAPTMAGIVHAHTASAEAPEGLWLANGEAAVQIFECNSLLCGRIRWLQARVILRDSSNATRGTPIRRCASANCAG
jgi:hypothetical protein